MVGDGKGDGDSVKVLPDAILEDILSKFHSKTLVKLRLVCKKWKSLISNCDFKILHQDKWPDLLFFTGCSSKGYFLTRVSLIGEVLYQWNIFSPRSSLSLIIMPPSQCGPNNNLVYFLVDGERFVVCNPSSRKLFYLPQLPYSKTVFAYGFCFLPSTNQYVIVCLSDKNQWQMITFCNMTNINFKGGWKPIKDINAPHRKELAKPEGIFAKGVLYWRRYAPIYRNPSALLCFDLYKETFFTVACPDRINRYLISWSLHDLKGDLHLMTVHFPMPFVTILWKLDVTNQTWLQQYKIHIDSANSSYLRPLLVSEDGEILFHVGQFLEWFGRRNNHDVFTRIGKLGDKRIPTLDFSFVRDIKVHAATPMPTFSRELC